jgi:hypothetical protein
MYLLYIHIHSHIYMFSINVCETDLNSVEPFVWIGSFNVLAMGMIAVRNFHLGGFDFLCSFYESDCSSK